jgi:NitT/TauT family transport system substrate-binding protein
MARTYLQRLIAVSIGAIGLAATSAIAADDVSIRLNWYQVGFHAPLYLGKEKGYFTDEGINLTINEGRGSAVAAQIVGAGDDTFGLADSGTLILSASKGIPIKAVASPMPVSPFGIVSRADANIKTAKDLEGKTLAVTAGDALTQLFPAVIAANNLDKDKINMVFVDPAGKVVAVLEKKADALLGSADAQVAQIEAKGVKAAALDFADIGVDSVGLTLIAHENTIKEKPDMIKRFIKAMAKSFADTVADPDAAIAAAVRAKPDANAESLKAQLVVDLELLESPATKGKGFGYNAPEDWERSLKLMIDYRELKTDRPASSFYVNDFITQ